MSELHELFRAPDGTELAARVRELVQDDPLNAVRMATAISETGAWPMESMTRAAREEIGGLTDADAVEFRRELERCLVGRDVDSALQWLFDIGAIQLMLPEVAACVDLAQEAGRRHKDVWEHTKLVVKQAVPRPLVRWAALLHDIGKVPTRTFTQSGVHFHGHAEVGARMFDKMARRIPFERDDKKTIRFLIKHHLRSNQYSESWTDSAVRRFYVQIGDRLTDLLDLSRADITSKRPGRRKALLRQISDLQQRVAQLKKEDAKVPPLPTGLGNAIMEHFELEPSRFIGDLKRALEAAIERGELEERRDEAYYVEWLDRSGLARERTGKPATTAPAASAEPARP